MRTNNVKHTHIQKWGARKAGSVTPSATPFHPTARPIFDYVSPIVSYTFAFLTPQRLAVDSASVFIPVALSSLLFAVVLNKRKQTKAFTESNDAIAPL